MISSTAPHTVRYGAGIPFQGGLLEGCDMDSSEFYRLRAGERLHPPILFFGVDPTTQDAPVGSGAGWTVVPPLAVQNPWLVGGMFWLSRNRLVGS
jgi:hypothetical protein